MADVGLLERLRELLVSRRFQWILTIALGVLVVLYLLFVSLFFNPFEEKLADTATIVPEDVDYFVRWRGAGGQFSGFPRLAMWSDVEAAPAWDEIDRSGAADKLAASTGLATLLAHLEGFRAYLPAGLSLEDDFLGEVVVAGKGQLAFDSRFDGVLMLRGSFKVRAGLAMLDWGFVRDKLPASVQVEDVGDGVYKLPQFELFGFRDAYLSRVKDVVVLASSQDYLTRARELDGRSGQESLAQASVFRDNVTAYVDSSAQPIEAFFRWGPLSQQIGTWPAPDATGFVSRLIGRFFDTSVMRFASGYVELDDAFTLRVSGDMDTSAASQFKNEWLRGDVVPAGRIREFASITPSSNFFLGVLAGDPGKVLQEAYVLMAADLRQTLDEAVQDSGRYQGMGHLLTEIGALLRPGVGMTLRRNDYPPAENDPAHDDAPVPLWAVYGKVRDPAKLDEVRAFFEANWRRFTGGNDDSIQNLRLPSRLEMKSFVSKVVPGTGEIVTVYIPVLETVVVSNSYRLVNDIINTAFPESARVPPTPLRDLDGFERTLDAASNGAHMLMWLDPSSARHWLEAWTSGEAERRFQLERESYWRQQRPQEEARLRQELFPGRAALSPQEENQLRDAVDQALLRADNTANSRLPALSEEVRQAWLPMHALDWVSATFRVSRRTASLHVQAQVDG